MPEYVVDCMHLPYGDGLMLVLPVSINGHVHERIVRCRDCKHGHITVNGKSCKWCDLIATHDPDGCEPYNGYDPEPYFDADFFCAWGKRRES